MKFNKINIKHLNTIFGGSYYDYDILRQTTIERLAQNYSYLDKEKFMRYILQQTALLLDKMIKE